MANAEGADERRQQQQEEQRQNGETTRRRTTSPPNDLYLDESSASSDFFSPISVSFFKTAAMATVAKATAATAGSSLTTWKGGTATTTTTTNPSPEQQHLRLPPLHDGSWIGARLSPIRSFDREELDDDEEDDDDEEEEYYRPRNNNAASIFLSKPSATYVPNEKTRLLGQTQRHRAGALWRHHNNQDNNTDHDRTNRLRRIGQSRIHPLWNSPASMQPKQWDRKPPPAFWGTNGTNTRGQGPPLPGGGQRRMLVLGVVACTISATQLAIMMGHDLFLFNNNNNNNYAQTQHYGATSSSSYAVHFYRNRAWSWPWLIPTRTTLFRFGALLPQSLLSYRHQQGYWRLFSSAFMATSCLEWTVVVLVYALLLTTTKTTATQPPRHLPRYQSTASMTVTAAQQQQPQPWHAWFPTYIGSVMTGQLWLLAWDTQEQVLTGCLLFGTSGVLCGAGMIRPSLRCAMFGSAILLLLVALFQRPYSSVVGTLGGAIFGWALGAAQITPPPLPRQQHDEQQDKQPRWGTRAWRLVERHLVSALSSMLAISTWVVPGLWLAFVER